PCGRRRCCPRRPPLLPGLWLRVSPATVAVPWWSLARPPPTRAVLWVKVLPLTATVPPPKLTRPPPLLPKEPVAELPVKVLRLTMAVRALARPPPELAVVAGEGARLSVRAPGL